MEDLKAVVPDSVPDSEYESDFVPDSEYESDSEHVSATDSEHVSESDSDLPKELEAAMDESSAKLPLAGASTSIGSAKRQNESMEPTPSNSKKAKQAKFTAEEKMKQVADQRLFSEDDEILVLQGLINFIEKNGNDNNMSEFYDVIAKSLNPNINRRQLTHKVSNLKNEFHEIESKQGDDESPSFSKPHDQKVFELSKKIWGVPTTDVVDEDGQENSDIDFYESLGVVLCEYLSHHGLDLDWVEQSGTRHLVEKWVKFKMGECSYFILRAKFEAEIQKVKMNIYREYFRL